MALHRDIFWIGRQWAVTGSGMQAINQKLGGQFDIEVARLWDDGWVDVLRAQSWLNAEDFAKGLAVARARYPEPPKVAPPPLPVETLLQARVPPEPAPTAGPVAAAVAEPERPLDLSGPEPAVPPVTIGTIEPAKPAAAFPQMNPAEHSARLLGVWRIQRRP